MKKFICFVVLGLLLGVALTQDKCLEIIRRDTLEKWVANKGSSMCTVSRKYENEFRTGFTANNGDFVVNKVDGTLTMNQAYVSEKTSNDVFSISVYRPNLDYSHFLTIEPTDDQSKWSAILYEDQDNSTSTAHVRTTHYIKKGDLTRENASHKHILIWTLVIIQAGLAISTIFKRQSQFGCTFNSFLLILTSVVFGWWYIHSTFWFIIIFIIIIAIAGAAGHFSHALPPIVSPAIGVLMIIYYFFGGAYENRWFFFIALVVLAIVGFLSGMPRVGLTTNERILYSIQLTVFWTQVYQFWSYVFRIYQPEIFHRFFKGPKDYRTGITGRGSALWYPSLIVLIIVAILAAVVGFLHRKKEEKDYEKNHKEGIHLFGK